MLSVENDVTNENGCKVTYDSCKHFKLGNSLNLCIPSLFSEGHMMISNRVKCSMLGKKWLLLFLKNLHEVNESVSKLVNFCNGSKFSKIPVCNLSDLRVVSSPEKPK